MSQAGAAGSLTATAPPHIEDVDCRRCMHNLVVAFYGELIFDDLLGPVFEEVAEVISSAP